MKTPIERILDRVQIAGDCWLWTGFVRPDGYGGQLRVGNGRRAYVHRISYELHVGPIAEGMVLDHLCRNRACVNPDHLEPVTQRVNILRGEGRAADNATKTQCVQGHLYDEENTYVYAEKARNRYCRICHRERVARYRARKKAVLHITHITHITEEAP